MKKLNLIGLGVFMLLNAASCKKDAECNCIVKAELLSADNQVVLSNSENIGGSESNLSRKEYKEFKEECEEANGRVEEYTYNDGMKEKTTWTCNFKN